MTAKLAMALGFLAVLSVGVLAGEMAVIDTGLTGQWLLTMTGTACEPGDCIATPYCASALICAEQLGSQLLWRVCPAEANEAEASSKLSTRVRTPLPDWVSLRGFADCGSIFLGTGLVAA